MTHHRTGNHNSRNIYRVDDDGTETHVGCMFAESYGPRVAAALNAAEKAAEVAAAGNRSGAGHYWQAEQYLEAARDHYHDSTRADRPHTERDEAGLACQMLTGMARAHAQLATAAAAAMPTVAHYLGDAVAITDWAHAIGWPRSAPGYCWDCGYRGHRPKATCPHCGDQLLRRPRITDEEPLRA
jgi:hypothetical protein